MKDKLNWCFVALILGVMLFWGVVIYVAGHFIRKHW